MHFPALPDRSILADWRRWLPVTIEVGLVALLAVQLVRAGWLLFAPTASPAETTTATATAPSATPALPLVDLFFRSATSPVGSGSAMGYALHGVRSDGDGHGSAILGKDGFQASYAVGHEVADGVVLESTGTDHAVLRSGGARHRLELPGRIAVAATATHAPPAPPRKVSPTTTAAADRSPVTASAPPVRTATPASPAALDIPELISKAGLRPSLGGGFTFSPKGDAALLKQAGLAPGDVLLAVDGRPLSLTRLPGLADELKGRSQVEIRYRRDDQIHTTLLKAPR